MSRSAKAKRRRKSKGQGKRKGRRKAKVLRTDRGARRCVPRQRKAATTWQKLKRNGRRPRPDPRLEIAVREMNRGRSLSATARSLGFSAKSLQDQLRRKRLIKRKGKRWVTKDKRLRRVPAMTGGRFRVLTVRGYEQARLVGKHHHAVGEFVRTNDINFIKPFKGRSVRSINGRDFILETDPNALHRIAAMDSPPFHEIYEITSNT